MLRKDLDSLYCSETVANRIHGFLLLTGQLVLRGNVVTEMGFLIHVILTCILHSVYHLNARWEGDYLGTRSVMLHALSSGFLPSQTLASQMTFSRPSHSNHSSIESFR